MTNAKIKTDIPNHTYVCCWEQLPTEKRVLTLLVCSLYLFLLAASNKVFDFPLSILMRGSGWGAVESHAGRVNKVEWASPGWSGGLSRGNGYR